MIITILAEPRSGSTNLANWFSTYESFTVFQEPLNRRGLAFQNNKPINEWKFNTPHLLIKEIYTPTKDLKELIERSDKLILLYRENYSEQIESWLVASETDKWASYWIKNRIQINDFEPKKEYFKNLKDGFLKDYLSKSDFFKISYEKLYYQNSFQEVLDYIDLDELKNINFPYGNRYRIDELDIKTLI